MDVPGSTLNNDRILIARSISTEQPNVELNKLNGTPLCVSLEPPDIATYFSALQGYGWMLWSGGAILVTAIVVISCITLQAAFRHRRSTNLIFVIAVYPVVACASYVWLVVPRSGPLAEALAQLAVMLAMYRLQRVIIDDCGGADQLLARVAKGRLETRLPPCCFLPCCVIPRPETTRRVLNCLRLMVLQMPIIQTLIYIALLILWAEDQNLYYDSYTYFIPLIIASILSGIWAMNMCVRAAETIGVKIKAKFFATQLTLIIVKLQSGIFRGLPKWTTLPCNPPLTPPVYMNLANNALTIFEMLILAIWAWRLYRVPPSKLFNKIQQVKVIKTLEDHLSPTIEPKSYEKGIENKSFSRENNAN